MIIEVAGMLTLAGFLTWILGAFFEYTEIAAIGATIIVATGAMIVTGGLEYQTGEVVVENTTYNGSVVGDSTNSTSTIYNSTQSSKQVSYEYESVPLPQQFPGGMLLVIVGGMLFIRSLGEDGGLFDK